MVINPIVGVYIPIIRIPIKGGMTIPNIATFDHGTYIIPNGGETWWFALVQSLKKNTLNESKLYEPSGGFKQDYLPRLG